MIRAVLFDFGGVIAEEGFRGGLMAIARKNRREPETFFAAADRIIYDCGYLTGKADEAAFWSAVRNETGVKGSDRELRDEILRRFVLRPEMLEYAGRIRAGGRTVALLSDQTNWIEEIDRETGLFRRFDRVFNSFRIGKSKRDSAVFPYICGVLGVQPGEALFIDDNAGHIGRAASQGLRTFLFTTVEDFGMKIDSLMRGQ